MSGSLSIGREIAYDAFYQTMFEKKKPEDALEALYAQHGKKVSRLDRNFAKEILFGSLRWYSKIFWILQNTASRDLQKTSPHIQTALVLGTYQIFYMDRVPDRAAVNESVEYVRIRGNANAVSFANGILRQIARRAAYFAKPDKVTKKAEYLALQFAHPRWIVDRWLQHFHFDKMEVMLAANNQAPPYAIRVNTRKVPIDQIPELQLQMLKTEKTHTERRPLRVCMHTREAPNLDADSLFQKGNYTIQDEAAQIIGYLVAPKADEAIVDTCCGPGGKLGHVFELADGNVQLTGLEKNPSQMARVRETLQRLGHEGIDLVETDFLEWNAKQKLDKVLLDAPCSGLGVLRRHPEGKWQKDAAIIPRSVDLQKKMILHALKQLKAGGELIFSVCSFEPDETVNHVKWLKTEFGDKVELISPVHRLPDYYKRYVTRDNVLLIYSGNQDGMDGFGAFIIKLKNEL